MCFSKSFRPYCINHNPYCFHGDVISTVGMCFSAPPFIAADFAEYLSSYNISWEFDSLTLSTRRRSSLQWRHNERDACRKSPASRLFAQLFVQGRSKKTSEKIGDSPKWYTYICPQQNVCGILSYSQGKHQHWSLISIPNFMTFKNPFWCLIKVIVLLESVTYKIWIWYMEM